ncbi:MAG: DUF2029 domain-containing protein [Bacteroidetes bacterium]|nr:DUF2029 domain-containing protein [Bacteroidota bacterium]
MIKRLYNNSQYLGFIIIILSLIIYLLLELKNNKFELVDYEVYYKAAQRILNGENLFTFNDGHFRYKYSPVAAVYFIPFSFMPLHLSKFIYWIFSIFVITSIHLICVKLLFPKKDNIKCSQINNIVLLSWLCLSVHFMFDIHLGQVNILLYLLYSLMVLFYIKRKDYIWPLLIALSLFLKPFGLIFIPYLILKKKYKQVGLIIGYIIVIACVPLIFYGTTEFINQYNLWFNELGYELAKKQHLLANGNHTIFSVLARYTPLRLLEYTPIISKIYQWTVLVLIGFFILWFINKGKDQNNSEIINFGLIIGIIPLLAFTDTNSFGALYLIIFYLLAYFKQMSKGVKIITISGLIMTSSNIYDIWGVKLFTLFKELSILSIGAIFLIISLSILRKRKII